MRNQGSKRVQGSMGRKVRYVGARFYEGVGFYGKEGFMKKKG